MLIQRTWKKKIAHFFLRLSKRGLASEINYVPFAILEIICFPLGYLFWLILHLDQYENYTLRLIGLILALLLGIKDFWPRALKVILPFYWYVVLLYTLPFFFSFMLFKNSDSSIWLIALITGLMFLLLLIDWLGAIFIFVIGVLCGWWAYVDTTPVIVTPIAFFETLPAYLTLLIGGSYMAYRNAKAQKAKLDFASVMGSGIAHELRTPLRTIQSYSEGASNYLPELLETYRLAKEAKLPIPRIDPLHFQALQNAMPGIAKEVRSAFTFIDMLLVNVNASAIEREYYVQSMLPCIKEALERYPFDGHEESKVHVEDRQDFTFKGDRELMVHVLFNLLKNALYYLRAARKGEIHIWTELGDRANQLHFKDTGSGIPANILPYIFDRFFTSTFHGTGIGLAFCQLVMQGFGGEIRCFSTEDVYTEFVLYFPKE